jgi:hypothetical protein
MAADDKQPTPEELAKAAFRQIRNDVARLFAAWDPLSLRGLPNFQKEYDPYVAPVAVLVRKRASTADLVEHLTNVCRDEWRLPPDRRKIAEMAEKFRRTGGFLDVPEAAKP